MAKLSEDEDHGEDEEDEVAPLVLSSLLAVFGRLNSSLPHTIPASSRNLSADAQQALSTGIRSKC
jgi:hypothetical protein